MADRTVTVRLRLDSTAWAAGQRSIVSGNSQMAASAATAATAAERDAQRTASAIQGTFRGMAAAGEASLHSLSASASRTSEALATAVTGMSRETAVAATAASQATIQGAATAAAATRQVGVAAGEIPAAFQSASVAAASSLGTVSTAAMSSSAALATAVTGMTQETAAAATAAAGVAATVGATAQAGAVATVAAAATTATGVTAAASATTAAATTAAAATHQISVTAGEIPAAFRAAAASATASLATLDATSAASRAAVTQTLLAERQALTMGAAAITQTSAGIAQVTASGLAGAGRLSLATRLTLASATAASSAATSAATATAARVSTAAHLASAGASSAAAGAAAATSRADAAARALGTTFGATAARARAMGSAVVTASSTGERSLKATRTASLVLVAAMGVAVFASSKFESAMSRVKAATQASGDELGQLRTAAIQAGSSTQYSATQAADGVTELAKAGVSTSDILGGALKGTLSLASAGEMDVADSAVVAAKAMNSFGLTGKDMAHIADVIAAAAGKSATDVHGMSLAFAQSSLLAHQTGLSLEQTAGSLALFAQNGLVGSDAGTSLKTMLMRLTPQSDEARGMMDKLGFSAYDADGNFVGLSETAARMQKSFGSLTPEARNAAMGVIFGSDAIRAATIISQAGAAGIDTWTKAANDQGYAARYAATQTDNLEGDVHRLASALETALITSGTAANGMLRDMAKRLTDLIRWYSGLNPEVQQSVTVIGGLAGAVTLVAAGLLLMLPRIRLVQTELSAMGLTAVRTRGMMLGLGRLSLVVGVLGALSYATHKLGDAMADAPPDVSKLTNSLIDLAKTGKASGDVASTLGDDLDGFGDSVHRIAHAGGLTKVTDELGKIPLIGGGDSGSLRKAKDQLDSVDQSLADMVSSGNIGLANRAFDKLSKSAEDNGTSTEKLMTMLPGYSEALTNADTQQKLAADSSKDLGDATGDTADELQDTRTEVEKLGDALDALNGANINVAQSQISFRQSLADLKSTVKENGHSLDITRDAGRKVKGAFLDAADAAMANAKAVTTQTNSQEAGNKALAEDVAALKQQMLQMGFSKEAVDSLLSSYAKVPSQKVTEVKVEGHAAVEAELDKIHDQLAATKSKSITVKALTTDAEKNLVGLGYHVTHMKGGKVQISLPTGAATSALNALQARVNAIANADHTIHMNVVYSGLASGSGTATGKGRYADGGIVHAAQGLYVPGYRPRVDTVHAVLSEGEGVLVPETVRRLGTMSGLGPAGVIKALNSWGRYGTAMRFANGGMVGGAQHYAGGGFTYAPADPTSTLGVEAGWDRYNSAVSKVNAAGKALTAALADAAKKAAAVKDAEKNLSKVRSGHHTASQLAAAEDKLTKARTASTAATKKAAADRKALNSADAALGVKAGTTSVTGFNLAAYEKQLAAANAANAAWEKNLATIGGKAGQDVEDILRSMGSDGTALVAALAKASGSEFAKIVAQLKQLAPAAQATLKDYTAQLNAANKGSTTFQQNLLKLAAMGDTALAAQLAAQGDDAAAAIAAEAVKSPAAASAANKAAGTNAALLTSDDLANALTLIALLRSKPGAGLADVLGAGLDLATIKALVPKIQGQLNSLPTADTATFLAQLAGQGGATAMARGGILSKPTAVLAAEAGSRESWIPWNGSARSAALLSATAAGMGYQLVPAGRYAGAGSGGGASVQHNTRHNEVHLHGAKQTASEQAADIARVLDFVG